MTSALNQAQLDNLIRIDRANLTVPERNLYDAFLLSSLWTGGKFRISDFVKKGDFKIIHLKRRNKLKQYISWKKVKEGDEWGDNFLINNGDNPWLNSKIEIDVDDLLNRFKIEEEQEKIYDEKFPNALEVYY